MYSHKDILRAIQMKKFIIEPFSHEMLEPNSVFVHIDDEIAIAKKGKVDPVRTKAYDKFFTKKKIDAKNGFVLKPGMLILGRTKERVGVSEHLGVLIDGRSTLSRLGVSVTQTAMIIEAGHGTPEPRKIVLEISNSGPFDVVLSRNMRIGKLMLFDLKSKSAILYDSYGKYGKKRDELLPRA